MRLFSTCSCLVLGALLSNGAHAQAIINSPDFVDHSLPILSRKAPSAPSPLEAYGAGGRWTGVNFGVQWGVGFGQAKWSNPTGLLAAYSPTLPASSSQIGGIGGGNVGFGLQRGHLFVGGEAEFNGAGLLGDSICGGAILPGLGGWSCRAYTDYLASFTLRGGIVEGDLLVYGKLGMGYEQDREATGAWVAYGPNVNTSVNQSRFGLTAGGGAEMALSSHWSARVEYQYYNFGGKSFSVTDPNYQQPSGANVQLSQSLIKFGLDFRLGDEAAPSGEHWAWLDDFTATIGGRAGFGTGQFQKNLFDNFTPGQLNSRLTWNNQNGLPLEGFARVDHQSGVYSAAMLGGAALTSPGNMTDEDFPPALTPYSRTTSNTGDNRTIYGVVDIGYNYAGGPNWKAGPLVGYTHYQQGMNAYNCTQQTTSSVCQPTAYLNRDQLTLSENESWDAVRVGVSGDVTFADRINLAANAAWLPFATMTATDNHWLRPDINALHETASGSAGFQIEGVTSYLFTRYTSLGLGARYWSFAGDGSTQFPGAANKSPEKFTSQRTTVFVELATRIGAVAEAGPLNAKY